MLDTEVRQQEDHVLRGHPALYVRGQTFPRIFIDHIQNAKRSPIMSPIRHKVIRPDMMLVGRAVADTGPLREPQPSPLRLLLRDL